MIDILTYPDEIIIYDYAYLRYLLEEERDAIMITYIEQHFKEESYKSQIWLMLQYPFFANKILDDYEMENLEKQKKLFNKLVYSGGGKIVLIDGSRGGGKTGTGTWILDEIHKRISELKFYFITKSQAKIPLPNWIIVVNNVDEVPNDSIALIDEGAIQLSSRRSWTDESQETSDKLVALRHKGITMIILVQNILMVDVNVRRLADVRILKYGIPFGVERRKTGEMISKDLELIRTRLKPKNYTEAYIEIPSDRVFLKFNHPLPEWWDDNTISKSLKDFISDRGKERREKFRLKRDNVEFEHKLKEELEIKKLEKRKEIEIAKIEKKKELGMFVQKEKKKKNTTTINIEEWLK